MTLEAIIWKDGQLKLLDQLVLPEKTSYIDVKSTHDGWVAINSMQVRGAPAIAITACLSVGSDIIQITTDYLSTQDMQKIIIEKLQHVSTARPTAVNLTNATSEMIQFINAECHVARNAVDLRDRYVEKAKEMLEKDLADNKNIGNHGAEEILANIPGGSSAIVLTHCNTGSLATAGYGTALGVIRSLKTMKKLDHVYCTETRPYLQGARLTAYELVYEGIPSSLICDDMVAAGMKLKNINAVVVGADRIVANGDTANKIGTYQIAILAKYHNIPFYVAASSQTVDFRAKNGSEIVIEERAEKEMTHLNGTRIAADGIGVWNPAFDVTPAELITGIITEFGVYKPNELLKIREKMSE